MSNRAARAVVLALSAAALLSACDGGGGDQTAPGGNAGGGAPAPRSLGLMELTINNLGNGRIASQMRLISPARDGQAIRAASLTPKAAGLDVAQVTATTVDVGTRGVDGMRYVSVVYKVRNAQFCGTPGSCAAYPDATGNLTMIGAATATNLFGTAVTQILREDGSTDATEQGLATSLMPTHGMAPTNPAGGVMLASGEDSLQVFSEAEIAGVPLDSGASGLFPYGYVVKNTSSTTSRSLPGNPADGQYDGQLTFAFKFPLQPSTTDDPFSVSFLFQVVDDANTRVTQSAEEQDVDGDLAATLRAVALGGTDLAVLGGRVAETNIGDAICSVRTAGTAAAPTAFLADNAGVTLAAAPFNLQVDGAQAVSSAFCSPMAAMQPTTVVVSGSQTAGRGLGGTGNLIYGGSGASQSFKADAAHPFMPGERVSVTYTTGLTTPGSTPLPLARPYVGSFWAKVPTVTNGVFGGLTTIPTTGEIFPEAIALADMDGDGKLDMVVADNTDLIDIWLNNGTGGFTNVEHGVSFAPTGGALTASALALALADLEGKGTHDLILVDNGNNVVIVGVGPGPTGDPRPPFNIPVTAPTNVAVGDFNGDGALDLLVTTGDGHVVVLLNDNDGSGALTAGTPIPVGTFMAAATVGDFNGDGKLDVAVADPAGRAVDVLLGNGDGSFLLPATKLSTGSSPGPESVASEPYSVVAADFNGDGKLDIAAQDYATGDALVMLGDGTGHFASVAWYTGAPVSINAASEPMVAGDFNGDGRMDLALLDDNGQGGVTLLLNSGSGFSPGVFYPLSLDLNPLDPGSTTFPLALAAGDVNSDGALDLTVINSGPENIAVLLNQPPL